MTRKVSLYLIELEMKISDFATTTQIERIGTTTGVIMVYIIFHLFIRRCFNSCCEIQSTAVDRANKLVRANSESVVRYS